MSPGPDHNFLYAPLGVRRNPADLFGNKRTQATHLAHHGAAFYCVDPHGRTVDAWHGGFEPGKRNRYDDESENRPSNNNDAALAFLFSNMRAWYIHGRGSRSKSN